MSSVKPLPKSIHSVVRSRVLLYDLTSVVEELVFNSLDSGAKTVSIFIGIGACSIKVVDDGSGISRDDLVLLGERYATSKYQKAGVENASTGIFGSRGEALASISDIAVLEIISKAHGRPNGYRKVLKGCKCMHLGIDADRKDMGTTVFVRDLFYNQPIRQKSILSCPNKVLESVKRCVLLIAFVHPQIIFKVVDIDSDDQLLCTRSSSTPLPLLRCQYGNELCSSLFDLNAQDGSLKFEGYLSGPNKDFAIKAFQHVYINSRPVTKGPIHKLVNRVASMFECMEIPVASDGLRHGKRSRASSCISFLLNLRCPHSQYDLIFEPSKTYAEFKDWNPVLAFIEKSIKCCWKENLSKACNPRRDEVWKEGQNSISAITVEEFQESPRFSRKKPKLTVSHEFHDLLFSLDSKECNWLSKCGMGEDRPKKCKSSVEDFYISGDKSEYLQFPFEYDRPVDKYTSTEALNCDASAGYWWSPDNGVQSIHGCSYADYNMLATDHTVKKHSSEAAADCHAQAGHHWSPEYAMQFSHTKSHADDNLQERILSPERTRSDIRGSFYGLTGQNESLKFDSFFANTSDMTSTKDHQLQRDNIAISSGRWRPFKSCSLQGYAEESGFNIRSIGDNSWKNHSHEVRKKNISLDDGTNFRGDKAEWNFSSFSGSVWHDEACSASAQPGKDTLLETDFLSATSVTSLPSSTEHLAVETGFTSDSLSHRFPSSSFKWSADNDILQEPEEYGQIQDENRILESGTVFTRRDSSWHLYDGYSKYVHDIDAKRPGKGNYISSFSEMGYNSENYASRFKHSSRQWIEENFLSENFAKDILSDDGMRSWDSHHRRRTSRENANSRDAFFSEGPGNVQIHQERPTRSLSAPPFYRKKKRLKFSNSGFTSELKKFTAEAGKQNHSREVFSRKHSSFGQGGAGHLPTKFRVAGTCKTGHDIDMEQMSAGQVLPFHSQIFAETTIKSPESTISVSPMIFHESRDYGTKLRDSYLPVNTNHNSVSVKSTHQSQILSTGSGILRLVSDSLVPKSITRECLASAQVLQQIDKKFIPIVAGQTLAIIDQHAADERIRLEELRKKVLSGEVKKVTYLDSEKEFVLPEMAHQMLHNYKDQVESWGWICSIHTENSASFRKNFTLLNGWPTVVTLLAVPCILGVDLTDGDLLEFLQQLAETDGSSIMPPSVLRILNFKACRGAIMFGDSLLPSECSLLVEELKKTQLCFQCAHGRPTTVPLVNLDELHKQVRELYTLDDRLTLPWHGLRRHEINLERTTDRLNAALR